MAARDHAPDHTDHHTRDHVRQPVDIELECATQPSPPQQRVPQRAPASDGRGAAGTTTWPGSPPPRRQRSNGRRGRTSRSRDPPAAPTPAGASAMAIFPTHTSASAPRNATNGTAALARRPRNHNQALRHSGHDGQPRDAAELSEGLRRVDRGHGSIREERPGDPIVNRLYRSPTVMTDDREPDRHHQSARATQSASQRHRRLEPVSDNPTNDAAERAGARLEGTWGTSLHLQRPHSWETRPERCRSSFSSATEGYGPIPGSRSSRLDQGPGSVDPLGGKQVGEHSDQRRSLTTFERYGTVGHGSGCSRYGEGQVCSCPRIEGITGVPSGASPLGRTRAPRVELGEDCLRRPSGYTPEGIGGCPRWSRSLPS